MQAEVLLCNQELLEPMSSGIRHAEFVVLLIFRVYVDISKYATIRTEETNIVRNSRTWTVHGGKKNG